jgi:nucleotide-binding universal stress UspA family protein
MATTDGPRLQHIVCAIDASEPSAQAMIQARAFARWSGARLTSLHISAPVAMAGAEFVPVMADQPIEEAERGIRNWMRARFRAAADAVEGIELVVKSGTPARCIVSYAAQLGADLLVIGTHGSSGFEHFVLGSVAEKVLRTAPCPVLTVPPHGLSTARLPFARVLCALDFSECSLGALEYAMSAAVGSGAALTLAHVLEWPWAEPPAPAFGDLPGPEGVALAEFRLRRECQAKTHLEALIPKTLADRCHTRVLHGRAYAEILRAAAEEHADLIVVGVHGRGALDIAILGSTTNQLVRRATCPVLTVRH